VLPAPQLPSSPAVCSRAPALQPDTQTRSVHARSRTFAGILIKLYCKIGQIAESEDGSYKGLVMPMDESKNESKGFAFIEFLDKKVRVSFS
jgi:hypothetical protein